MVVKEGIFREWMFQQGDLSLMKKLRSLTKSRWISNPYRFLRYGGLRSPYGLIQPLKQNSYRLKNICVFNLDLISYCNFFHHHATVFDRTNFRRNIYIGIIDYLLTSLNIDFGLPKGTSMTLWVCTLPLNIPCSSTSDSLNPTSSSELLSHLVPGNVFHMHHRYPVTMNLWKNATVQHAHHFALHRSMSCPYIGAHTVTLHARFFYVLLVVLSPRKSFLCSPHGEMGAKTLAWLVHSSQAHKPARK